MVHMAIATRTCTCGCALVLHAQQFLWKMGMHRFLGHPASVASLLTFCHVCPIMLFVLCLGWLLTTTWGCQNGPARRDEGSGSRLLLL